jgi:para-nitrobenzyl esterase
MGFLCLPELKQEAGHTGNYGLFDQMTAISWVRDNIAAFGGDVNNITIMGQSAGGASVQLQSQSPLTEGMFQKAIMSSGCGLASVMGSFLPEKSYDFWHAVMERCGCATLEEFRALDPAVLFAEWQKAKKEIKGGQAATSPVIDGVFNVKDSKPHDISYMAGSTSHDVMPPMLYTMAKNFCSKREKPSYLWYFDRKLPGDDNGAWHSSDLWYWFGTLANCWRPMEPKDYELSEQMVSYLCNFVKTGNPNKGGELPTWIASDKTQKRVLCFGEKPTHMGKASMLKLVKTLLTNKAVGE